VRKIVQVPGWREPTGPTSACQSSRYLENDLYKALVRKDAGGWLLSELQIHHKIWQNRFNFTALKNSATETAYAPTK